jgi:hypothetical protein
MPDKIKAVLEVVIGLAALLCNGEDFEDMETFRQEREQLIFFPRAMNRTLVRGVRVSARL